MYVDSTFLLIIYVLSASAALISVYALWTLHEYLELAKKNQSKKTNAWDHYHSKAQTNKKSTARGHWD